MAQTVQIVPRFSFPYVETVINDYTVYDDTNPTYEVTEPTVRYIFPFVSSKGIDNTFIRKRGRDSIVAAYGETNFKLYGQPLMQALEVAKNPYAEIWCMRVMPENATHAHKVITALYLADTEGTASERKFRIKFTAKVADGETTVITDAKSLKEFAKTYESSRVSEGVYKDGEGYIEVPGVIRIRSNGRGKYGNAYRVRLTQNMNYENDFGIKFYSMEILSTEKGLVKTSNYVGCLTTSPKYNTATLINDILEDQEVGTVPVFIDTDEDAISDIFDAYIAWLTDLIPELQAEYDEKYTEYAIPEGMMDGTVEVTEEYAEKVDELLALQDKIEFALTETTSAEVDTFDLLFGRLVNSTEMNPFLFYPSALTSDVDTSAEDYNAADYTQSEIVDLERVAGVPIAGGSDGYFDKPRTSVTVDEITGEEVSYQWTVEDEVAQCYLNAFSGEYDKKILTPRRLSCAALWDANYPFEVKNAMVNLALLRNDSLCYLDCGLVSSFGTRELEALIRDYSVFNDFRVSKNLHQFTTKEDSTKKRVEVTISYFLARNFASHVVNYGSHIPMVKSYAQLSGHMRDSLYPAIESYDTELKETLCKNRFNYFETIDENVFQRAIQNTSQMDSSDLLEESNVMTLFEIKRRVEMDIHDRLYDFADQTVRRQFQEFEAAQFADWGNRKVESVSIEFKMNEFEAQRSILHAYVAVVFRGLQKKAILEIDVNPRDYSAYSSSIATSGSSVVSYEF